MEKTPGVKSAVDSGEAVVACAYQGHVPEDVIAALPKNFKQRSYVAKFEDGKLVRLLDGMPEEVILSILPTPVEPSQGEKREKDCKSCDDKTCEDCEPRRKAPPATPTN